MALIKKFNIKGDKQYQMSTEHNVYEMFSTRPIKASSKSLAVLSISLTITYKAVIVEKRISDPEETGKIK